MPTTNSIAISTVTYAATTASGMASTRARNLGSNAITMNEAPMATPTRREATPVSSVMATLLE